MRPKTQDGEIAFSSVVFIRPRCDQRAYDLCPRCDQRAYDQRAYDLRPFDFRLADIALMTPQPSSNFVQIHPKLSSGVAKPAGLR